MEPDHTGAVQTLRAAFPNLTIVGNAKTIDMLKGYYGICDGTLTWQTATPSTSVARL